jgi:hypothetical protein
MTEVKYGVYVDDFLRRIMKSINATIQYVLRDRHVRLVAGYRIGTLTSRIELTPESVKEIENIISKRIGEHAWLEKERG